MIFLKLDIKKQKTFKKQLTNLIFLNINHSKHYCIYHNIQFF